MQLGAAEVVLVEATVRSRPSDDIPCEMAVPVEYAPDGRSVLSFRPCVIPAKWRLVLRWPHLVDNA